MDEAKARKIIGEKNIKADNSLYSIGHEYFYWNSKNDVATLDGKYNIDELEAIVWWMKNKRRVEGRCPECKAMLWTENPKFCANCGKENPAQ